MPEEKTSEQKDALVRAARIVAIMDHADPEVRAGFEEIVSLIKGAHKDAGLLPEQFIEVDPIGGKFNFNPHAMAFYAGQRVMAQALVDRFPEMRALVEKATAEAVGPEAAKPKT